MKRRVFIFLVSMCSWALAAAQPELASHFESADGYTVSYPDNWSIDSQRYRNALELIGVSNASGEQVTARIVITTENRLDHAGALQRLREIDAEFNAPGRYLQVGGWPALQRQVSVLAPSPGTTPQENGDIETRVTTAIAVAELLVRVEGAVPGDDAALVDEILLISNHLAFARHGDPLEVEREIQELQASPRLVDAGDGDAVTADGPGYVEEQDDAPNMVTPSIDGSEAGLVQRFQTGNVDSEVEIAVSNDGQNVVVANNGRVYTTSNDGGQTFPTSGVAPSQPVPGAGANGDPSLAFGASGNFYFAFIGFPAAGQCSTGVDVSTDNGQNFNFASNATICDNNQGMGSVGPSCFPDQEHIAADRINLSTVNPNQDQVYSTWRNFSGGGCGPTGSPTQVAGPEIPTLVCSNDSATTWSAPVVVGTGAYPRITVGSDGFVYVVYRNNNNIMLNKFSSCDNGLAQQGGFPQTVATVARVTCPVPGIDRCNNGSDFTSQMVAVDDTNPSHVFVSYAVSTNANVNENVIVRDSVTGGASWPAARSVQLNGGAVGRRFMPWICATNGTAYATWYDMRASTAMQNDLADFYGNSAFLNGGNLAAGTEFRISTVADALCASGWPSAPRSANDSESCLVQPQLAGNCTNTLGAATGQRCDFSDCGGAGNGTGAACQCNTGAGETCNLGRGVPKYGDYNGNACGNGQLFAAWASATSPPGIVPGSTDIDLFFDTPLNDPPIADAGPDQTLECTAGGTVTSLDGSGSSDPDGNPITYSWQNNFVEGGGTVNGVNPMVTFPSLGSELVTLTVQDSVGFTDTDTMTVSVADTTPPMLSVPADVTMECAAPTGTAVDIGMATASDSCDTNVSVSNDAPTVFPLGDTTVTWTAIDDSGNTAMATQTVTVEDTIPPELTVEVSPHSLWPPRHDLRSISADVNVFDICDPDPAVRLTSITSNEPDNGTGDGDTDSDIQGAATGSDDREFELRAERSGSGAGRVYTINYEAEDGSGNTTSAVDEVTVPQSKND